MCTGLAHSSSKCVHSTAPRWLHQLLWACCTVAAVMQTFATSPAIIMIFTHNKPACVSVVLRWDNPTQHDSYLSTLHSPQVTCCKRQTPKQLAHQTYPKFTLPLHVSKVVYQTENTNITKLWQNVTADTSTATDTLQCTMQHVSEM